MKLFFIFTVLFISFNSFALESSDKFSTNVIKAYDKNFLVISRGLEDGIYKGDHIKLSNPEGYIARAICVKAGMLLSHWKVYRVVNPEKLSMNSTYLLTAINQSEIPEDMMIIASKNYKKSFNDISDEDMKRELKLQQKRLTQSDLPKRLASDPRVISAKKTGTERFLEKNLDSTQLSNDFKKLRVTLFTSPLFWNSRNGQRSNRYGFALENRGDKYQLETLMEIEDSKVVDPFTLESVKYKSNLLENKFLVMNMSKNIDYFATINSYSKRQGDIKVPNFHNQIGILGFRYNFYNKITDRQYAVVSYSPILDQIKYETKSGSSESATNMRHAFEFLSQTALSSESNFITHFKYAPYMYLNSREFEASNSMTNLKFTLDWNVVEKLKVEYTYQYKYDTIPSKAYGIQPVENISLLNFKYRIDI